MADLDGVVSLIQISTRLVNSNLCHHHYQLQYTTMDRTFWVIILFAGQEENSPRCSETHAPVCTQSGRTGKAVDSECCRRRHCPSHHCSLASQRQLQRWTWATGQCASYFCASCFLFLCSSLSLFPRQQWEAAVVVASARSVRFIANKDFTCSHTQTIARFCARKLFKVVVVGIAVAVGENKGERATTQKGLSFVRDGGSDVDWVLCDARRWWWCSCVVSTNSGRHSGAAAVDRNHVVLSAICKSARNKRASERACELFVQRLNKLQINERERRTRGQEKRRRKRNNNDRRRRKCSPLKCVRPCKSQSPHLHLHLQLHHHHHHHRRQQHHDSLAKSSSSSSSSSADRPTKEANFHTKFASAKFCSPTWSRRLKQQHLLTSSLWSQFHTTIVLAICQACCAQRIKFSLCV